MKTKNIIQILENKFPTKNAEEWDNVGLILGDENKDIKKIQFSLDITEKVIKKAINDKIDMIISHHPMIFKPIKKINTYEILGKKILELTKNNINIYCMHTNLDSSINGLNDYILSILGVKNSKIIKSNSEFTAGIGRYYSIDKEITIKEYASILKSKLGIKSLRFVGNDFNKKIKRIALINGSAMSYWKLALNLKIDLFITGDISYHDGLDAKESGLSLIDFGHYESEKFFYEVIKKELEEYDLEFSIFNDGPLFEFI